MEPLVSGEWLCSQLKKEEIVVADCRFELADPPRGRQAYLGDHIPGAIYFHLEEDLSGPLQVHGGRHPVPGRFQMEKVLRQAGIHKGQRVIAYDDQGGVMAARLWWLLRYYGHDAVSVLDGGYEGWKEQGYPVSSRIPTRSFSHYQIDEVRSEMVVGHKEVANHEGVLLDARHPTRFAGKEEPIDKKAGHIPGAVNRFWKENLQQGQYWKDASLLKQEFSRLVDQENVIVYCGSGVTACVNLLALSHAGISSARLYGGSWSDWISYDHHPIQTEDERRE